MADVAQLTAPVRRWLARRRGSPSHPAGRVDPASAGGARIRRRHHSDVAACVRLLGLVAAEGEYPRPRPPSFRGWMDSEEILDAWVAERKGEILGHIALVRVGSDPASSIRWREVTGRTPPELAGVSRLFVRSRARGQGIGTALVRTAVDEARSRGLRPVAELVSRSRDGVGLLDDGGWRLAAMYPSGSRGDGLEAYLYVMPPDVASR